MPAQPSKQAAPPVVAQSSQRATIAVAAIVGLLAGGSLAWLLHRCLFQAHAQTFDAMIYGRSLWGIAHESSENSVVGVHWLLVHANFVLYLLAPLTALAEPVGILIAAQASALAATVALVVFHAARGQEQAALLALLFGLALTFGSPLFLNPFLFDVRPDLIGVPLCTASLVRIFRLRHVDWVAVVGLFAALLVREEFSMVIAPALVALPLERARGLSPRVRWSLACVALAYTLLYYLVGRQLIAGTDAVARVAEMRSSFLSAPTWESLSYKPEIIFVSLTAVGGLALLGWRWSVPAWPGLVYLLANNRLPEYTLTSHYALFAAPGLCVAAVAGAQSLRGAPVAHRRAAWAAVLVLATISGLVSSSAPGGRRFLARFFDLESGAGKSSRLAHTPAYLDARVLLERIPSDVGLSVPSAVSAALVDRTVVWDGLRLRRALGGQEPMPEAIRWVAVLEAEWRDTGKTLVQQHGFRLVDVANDWLALLTRDEVGGSALVAMTSIPPADSRSAARWPSAGLHVSRIGKLPNGQLSAVVVRDEAPAREVADRPLCLILDGLQQPVELTALSGVLNPREIPTGRAALFLGPAVAGEVSVFARLAMRDDLGQWVVLPVEDVLTVTVR